MSKMMKVIAILLVIAAVVFVAGCANKAPATENNTTPATTVTTAETPTVTPTEVVPAENETTDESEVTPAENVTTNESVVSPAENVTANVTENVTQVPTGGAPKSHNQRVIDLAKARTAANTT